MGNLRQMGSQNFYFFVHRFVLIHNKGVFAFDFTETAFNLYSGGPQILLANLDFQFLSQIFQFLINLFRFHLPLDSGVLKSAAVVLYLPHIGLKRIVIN
jgi:hypothetical protein